MPLWTVLQNRGGIIIKNKLILVIFLCVVFWLTIYAFQGEAYGEIQSKIDSNIIKINQCEDIKTQLHITAETIRKQEWYDTAFVDSLSAKWIAQNDYQNSLRKENVRLQAEIDKTKASKVFLGNFKITHYCNCSKCCGRWAWGATASDTMPKEGRTIAVDPKIIPLGSKVEINGIEYIAEDTGGAIKGNKIDIYIDSHSRALQLGVLYDVPVYLVK